MIPPFMTIFGVNAKVNTASKAHQFLLCTTNSAKSFLTFDDTKGMYIYSRPPPDARPRIPCSSIVVPILRKTRRWPIFLLAISEFCVLGRFHFILGCFGIIWGVHLRVLYSIIIELILRKKRWFFLLVVGGFCMSLIVLGHFHCIVRFFGIES